MKTLENVKFLTWENYWDGPLYGLCEYENKIYWYECIEKGGLPIGDYDDDSEEDFEYTPRIFQVKEIEPWQLSYCLYYHSLFATNVAAYTDFDKGLVDDRFKIKGNFYKKQKKEYKKIDFSNNIIIGKFELK